MKLAALGVTSSNLKETVKFYELLGFKFPEFSGDEDHLEPIPGENGFRLMLDSKKLITEIIGMEPKPSNHSAFAIEFDSKEDVDKAVDKIREAGYEIEKEPWDAFWGQRYSIVSDPDGYLIDLYANL